MRLCLKDYYDAMIYKTYNGVKKLIYDTKNNDKTFIDHDVLPNSIYQYEIIPYYTVNNKEVVGEKYYPEKIKTPKKNFGENWWINDFD